MKIKIEYDYNPQMNMYLAYVQAFEYGEEKKAMVEGRGSDQEIAKKNLMYQLKRYEATQKDQKDNTDKYDEEELKDEIFITKRPWYKKLLKK